MLTSTLAAMITLAITSSALALDLPQVEKELSEKGIEGWIHGSVEKQGLFVFTYRNKDDFFDYIEMSLVSEKPEITAQFASFARHDKVLIKGKVLKNPSPQKHIDVASISLVKKYDSGMPTEPYKYDAKIPEDLQKASRGTFLVHAIAGEGRVLVLEHRDSIVPMFVRKPELTKNLSRNDIVSLAYVVRTGPEHPMHLNLDDKAQEPVKVVEAINAIHGKPASVEGALILFPKSPEITFNIFALQQQLPDGLSRQFTLVNMEDKEAFARIRAKLQKAWDQFPKEYVNGRNKLVSLRVRVKATGTFNQISNNQANPQILLKDADSIEILGTNN